jgi:hypothetical protein
LNNIKLTEVFPALRPVIDKIFGSPQKAVAEENRDMLDNKLDLREEMKISEEEYDKDEENELGIEEDMTFQEKLKRRLRLVSIRDQSSSIAKYFDDAFMMHGFGVMAFFKIVETLILVFFIITMLVALP